VLCYLCITLKFVINNYINENLKKRDRSEELRRIILDWILEK